MLVTLKVFGLFSFLTNKEIKGKKMKLKKKKLFFLFHVKGGSGIEDSSGNRTNRMGREKRQKKRWGGVFEVAALSNVDTLTVTMAAAAASARQQ